MKVALVVSYQSKAWYDLVQQLLNAGMMWVHAEPNSVSSLLNARGADAALIDPGCVDGGFSGVAVFLAEIRQKTTAPVVVFASSGNVIELLEAGADDVMGDLTFGNISELVARLKSAARAREWGSKLAA